MLTRATKLKLTAFALVSVLALAYTGFHYANLGRYFGSRGYYVVRLDLANSGGVYPHAHLTHRLGCSSPGGAMRPNRPQDHRLPHTRASPPPLPARLHAAVPHLSPPGAP